MLYKYLDAKGGLAMLEHHNLQFTNATKFNDPFDCHPALFDYSDVPLNTYKWPPSNFVSSMEENRMDNLRKTIWMCCLSKVYDSLLMWSYYNGHKGICIGLNKGAVLRCCHQRYMGFVFPFAEEVKYKDILPKPDYFKEHSSWTYLLTTKAKVWEHEQEVRLITKNPSWVHSERAIPIEFKDDEWIDGKEVRYYPFLMKDCFESVYLGVNILPRIKTKVIKTAEELNPNIKIYQMTIDPKAFRLKAVLLERK